MITVSILYPASVGSTFNLDYYLSKHMPMVKDRMGSALRGVVVESGMANGTPGAPLLYSALCHMRFDSVEAFQAAFAAHAPELMSDIANYTNITPAIQISEVKINE